MSFRDVTPWQLLTQAFILLTMNDQAQIFLNLSTILIVEDDAALAQTIEGYLHSLGAKTIICKDGQEASLVLERNAGKIDLVISDVQMPVMDGAQLLEYVKKNLKNPPQVIVMSGYTSRANDLTQAHGAARLSKPFHLKDLEAVIEDVLKKYYL